jgi:uncharacterized protein YecT (DUF1311 family)
MDSLDISKLGGDYQILTELDAGSGSRTYLARHLRLNRDVVITAYDGIDRTALAQFADDVSRLIALRHPNVIPIIDGRWIGDATYAVVRARVRGATLHQVVDTEGAMPPAQVDETLRQIANALAWARGKGIVYRGVSPDALIFQQGSGRPLVAFEPSTAPVDDEQSIRALAAAMSGGAAVNVAPYLAILAPGAAVPTPLSPTMTVLETPRGVPVAREPAVVAVRSGMGFGTRVLTAAIIIAALVIVAVLLFQHHSSQRAEMAKGQRSELSSQAAGDVALTPSSPSSEPYASAAPSMPPASAAPIAIAPPISTPAPVVGTQPVLPAPPTSAVPAEPSPATGSACDSPSSSDQHSCLMSAILDHDRELNAVYQQLIAGLERQAGGDSNPESIRSLRAEERRWVDERDRACRSVGSSPLYARERAACFAAQSDARTAQLRQMLQAIPPGT